MTESPIAVTWPALNPGPAGRVVVVVVGGAVDVVVALGRVTAARWWDDLEVAEVSRTTKVVAAARTATMITTRAVTLPDGRRRFEVVAWRAIGHSFAARTGDQKSAP